MRRCFALGHSGTINPIEELVVVDPNEDAYEDLLVREFRKSLYDDEDLELLREVRLQGRADIRLPLAARLR
jgi:hypothetical protein